MYFKNIVNNSHKSHKDIYEKAQVSERMFYLIISGRTPTKATLLALALSLEMNIAEIENILQKAGYVLSKSIAFDMVVKWMVENETNKLMNINYVLDELELPFLMTREKSPN